MSRKYVIYYRVSTKKQGESGLGLKAQKAYLYHFLSEEVVVKEFTEIQSGGSVETRLVLQEALRLCQMEGYTLAVAKIDRLSRKTEDALSIYNLLEGRLFSCDIPNLDKFTLTLFMAIADRERELISIRTKQALDAKKLEIGEWRNSTFTEKARQKGQRRIREKARLNPNNRRATELILLYKDKGLTLQAIAQKLNQAGFRTAQGKLFQKTTVSRLWKRSQTQIRGIES
ncbi:recombinase family protein [Aureispira sp. CCB-QB1]|uniref:recombinase family protein n=1 Tax=Aureispira sp. CCB-QB1 TaxID=1313421 RepID=UPI0006978547|nr:recombinase family protein [Aureispira sp. CCB-QB1]